jgi:hypothetical protein
VYDQVRDDMAHAEDIQNMPIEEFMHHQAPMIFRSRFEGAINDINLHEGQILEGDCLHPSFVNSLTKMIDEAITSYKSLFPSDDAPPALITPAPSIAATAPFTPKIIDRTVYATFNIEEQTPQWNKSQQKLTPIGQHTTNNQDFGSVTTTRRTKLSNHRQYSTIDLTASNFYDISDANVPFGNLAQSIISGDATIDELFDSYCMTDSLWYSNHADLEPIVSKSPTQDDNTHSSRTNNCYIEIGQYLF